jgi:uncharacterized protein (DUF924 family)
MLRSPSASVPITNVQPQELTHRGGPRRTRLALILLLDQLPRNLFRNSPRAYVTDAVARQIAGEAVARGFDQVEVPIRRCFFYMPFQHSENITDQETALRLYGNLPEHPDKAAFVEAAHRHHAVVDRFGRFPHRNRILVRDSSSEDEAYLQRPDAAF